MTASSYGYGPEFSSPFSRLAPTLTVGGIGRSALTAEALAGQPIGAIADLIAAPRVAELSATPAYAGKHRHVEPSVVMRSARTDDLERIVDLDLEMFSGAYGAELPSRDEAHDMFKARLRSVQLGRGLMMVCEVNGVVQGFATYFKTNKPMETFKSWEDSTANGTLQGVTQSDGRYGYVTNMTVGPKGSAVRARERLTAGLMADGVESNIEFAHFISRIPGFSKWVKRQGIDAETCEPEELDKLANTYIELRRPAHVRQTRVQRAGKHIASALRSIRLLPGEDKSKNLVPVDYELRMYEKNDQFRRGPLVKGAFGDSESLNYGVLFQIKVPGFNKSRVARRVIVAGLRYASNHKRLAAKLF